MKYEIYFVDPASTKFFNISYCIFFLIVVNYRELCRYFCAVLSEIISDQWEII